MRVPPAEDALLRREAEIDESLRGSPPRSPAQLEKTIIIAARAIIEALYLTRH